eukprot:scaffold1790_cov257-Pinguiococcus_pyrenoidosus.AAC.47
MVGLGKRQSSRGGLREGNLRGRAHRVEERPAACALNQQPREATAASLAQHPDELDAKETAARIALVPFSIRSRVLLVAFFGVASAHKQRDFAGLKGLRDAHPNNPLLLDGQEGHEARLLVVPVAQATDAYMQVGRKAAEHSSNALPMPLLVLGPNLHHFQPILCLLGHRKALALPPTKHHSIPALVAHFPVVRGRRELLVGALGTSVRALACEFLRRPCHQ